MGPIEAVAVNGNSTTLAVLGQSFETSTEDSSDFVVGDYAVAADHATLGTTVYSVGTPYVAGVSTVRLKAAVTAVDSQVGTATLGWATVDYTATLSSNPAATPELDQAVCGGRNAACGAGVGSCWTWWEQRSRLSSP